MSSSSFPNTSEQLDALAALERLLAHEHVDYWLFGGWAVDFHAGQVTRAHADIDIAVWQADRARVQTLLLDRGWAHRPEAGEDGYTCYERETVRLEVAFLARDASGMVYTPLRDGRGDWPDQSFGDDVAQLGDVRVHLVGRESLVTDKSTIRADAETAAKDRADIASLLERS